MSEPRAEYRFRMTGILGTKQVQRTALRIAACSERALGRKGHRRRGAVMAAPGEYRRGVSANVKEIGRSAGYGVLRKREGQHSASTMTRQVIQHEWSVDVVRKRGF